MLTIIYFMKYFVPLEKFYAKFLMYCNDNNLPINTIQQKYNAYNKFFKIKEGLV